MPLFSICIHIFWIIFHPRSLSFTIFIWRLTFNVCKYKNVRMLYQNDKIQLEEALNDFKEAQRYQHSWQYKYLSLFFSVVPRCHFKLIYFPHFPCRRANYNFFFDLLFFYRRWRVCWYLGHKNRLMTLSLRLCEYAKYFTMTLNILSIHLRSNHMINHSTRKIVLYFNLSVSNVNKINAPRSDFFPTVKKDKLLLLP